MSSPAHDEQFAIRSYEVSPQSVLRPVVLLRMLQETAWKHASLLGKGYADREAGELFWVLSRLRMRIHSLPRWGEEITVRTQPIGVEKLFALREFTVLDAAGQTLAEAMSGWLLVDSQRGRPIRPGRLLDDIRLGEPRFVAELEAIAGLGDKEKETTRTTAEQAVRLHDIDQYGHVNNASYLEWILDAVDAVEHSTGQTITPPAELIMNFLKETLPGQSYRVLWERTADGTTAAEVRRAPDDEPVCRLQLRPFA